MNIHPSFTPPQKAGYKAAAGADTDGQPKSSSQQQEQTGGDNTDQSAGKYGDAGMIQSVDKHTERNFVESIGELAAHAGKAPVWIRGRVHTVRSKGKQSFLVLRKQSSTVQCVIIVDELRSKQMVKFCGR